MEIILGTVQLGINYGINNLTGTLSKDDCIHILNHAYDNGITYLDSASAYGEAENIIGDFHKKYPDKIFNVITKFSKADNIQSIDLVLNTLSVETLFSYMFHRFMDTQNVEIIQFLISLKKTNRVENIGISVYTNKEFEDAINLEYIDIIQIPYNLLDNSNKRLSLIKRAKEQNKKIHIRSVFLQGLFFMSPNTLPIKLKPLGKYITQINAISERANISINELALRYVMSNQYLDGLIVGVDNINQLKNNINLLSKPLNDKYHKVFEEIDEINVTEEELLNPTNWL